MTKEDMHALLILVGALLAVMLVVAGLLHSSGVLP